MFKQDYILKTIHEMVKMVLKLLFHIDDIDDSIKIENEEANEFYKTLVEFVKQNKINEAENYLYENLDTQNLEELKVALIFYEQLNQLSDEVLDKADFSREEIKDGIQLALEKFGYDGLTGAF